MFCIIPTPYNWSLLLFAGMQTSPKNPALSRFLRDAGSTKQEEKGAVLALRRGLIWTYTAGWGFVMEKGHGENRVFFTLS